MSICDHWHNWGGGIQIIRIIRLIRIIRFCAQNIKFIKNERREMCHLICTLSVYTYYTIAQIHTTRISDTRTDVYENS